MSDSVRQLAAVMFTDLVGYTALMQENEKRALEIHDRHRRVLESSIKGYKGKILHNYGDGTLSMFGSASDAVDCAVVIQRELQQEPKIPLRIGIHMGDIIYDDEGVYGDSVNIASRIQSLSVPGAVLISENIYDEIKNKPHLPAKHVGIFELKNVKRPVKVFAVTVAGLIVPERGQIEGKAEEVITTIAVLPFINMSPDPENEYFSDGITEELTNALTKIQGLNVIARTSAFAFKGERVDVREIGKKLSAAAVLEGSVRKEGKRVRVTAQLINAVDGYHIWSEVYNRNLEHIFELQNEISREIANRLTEELHVQSQAIADAPTKNMEAYDLYLKALSYLDKMTVEDISKAIKFYEDAVALDSDFAKAYAGLSYCYLIKGNMGTIHPRIAYPKAKMYARKAYKLNPDISESLLAVARVKLYFEWDWKGAYRKIQKAMEGKPGSFSERGDYFEYLTVMGRSEEALKEIQISAELNPLSAGTLANLGFAYLYLERYEDAFRTFQRALKLNSFYWPAVRGIAYTYVCRCEFNKAVDVFERLNRQAGDRQQFIHLLAFGYAKAGRLKEAYEYLDKLRKLADIEEDSSFNMNIASVYAALKDFDSAFYYLEKALDERAGKIIYLRNLIEFKELRPDPRFKKILKKMGLD